MRKRIGLALLAVVALAGAGVLFGVIPTGTPALYVAPGLSPLSTEGQELNPTKALARIYKGKDFYCSGTVVGNNYVITAAHCLKLAPFAEYTVEVAAGQGRAWVKARVAGFDVRTDVGMLGGDFSGAPRAELANDGLPLLFAPPLILCGYPGGNKKEICFVTGPRSNYAFMINVGGVVIPGMSGGPVFTPRGAVVGVISGASYNGGAYIGPAAGILGMLGIEP